MHASHTSHASAARLRHVLSISCASVLVWFFAKRRRFFFLMLCTAAVYGSWSEFTPTCIDQFRLDETVCAESRSVIARVCVCMCTTSASRFALNIYLLVGVHTHRASDERMPGNTHLAWCGCAQIECSYQQHTVLVAGFSSKCNEVETKSVHVRHVFGLIVLRA